MKRGIVLDDNLAMLKYLALLYKELPLDIRSTDPTIRATVVLMEAIEFIRLLRKTLDLHEFADRITELDDIYDERVKDSMRPVFQPVLERPPVPVLSSSVAQRKPVPVRLGAPPVAVTPVRQGFAPAMRNPLGCRPILPSGPVTVATRGIQPANVAGLDPSTRFVWLNGKLVRLRFGVPPRGSGVTPIRLGSATNQRPIRPQKIVIRPHGGSGVTTVIRPNYVGTVRLQQPSPSSVDEAPLPKIIQVGSIAKPQNEQPVVSGPHDANCLDSCVCQESDLDEEANKEFDGFTTARYKEKMLSCVRVSLTDKNPILCLKWVQNALFYRIFDMCCYNVKKIGKFLRVVSPDSGNPFLDEQTRSKCILAEYQSNEDSDRKGALIKLENESYCLPLVLVKSFRSDFVRQSLNNMVVYSKPNCKISKPTTRLKRGSTMCLNPHHYVGNETSFYLKISASVELEDHRHTYRLFGDDKSGMSMKCLTCLKVMPREESEQIHSEVDEDRGAASNAASPATNNGSKETAGGGGGGGKPVVKVSEAKDKTIEEFEEDFEGMLARFEEEVDKEAADEEPEILATPPAKKAKTAESEGRFSCWRCHSRFTQKQLVKDHDCSRVLTKSHVLYSCRLCGTSTEEKEDLSDHLNVCYARPNKQSALDVVEVANNGDVRLSDNSNARLENVCLDCDVQFDSHRELLVHNETLMCCHVQCLICFRCFANVQTHASHGCYNQLRGKIVSDQIVKVELSHVLNQVAENSKPVKCQDCGNTLQSYGLFKRHKNAVQGSDMSGACGCGKKFPSMCAMLQHSCDKSRLHLGLAATVT